MVDWESFYSAFRKPGFIPGYEIQNHLGGGAFGEVYKARKTSIGKPYAIKFLKLDDETNHDAIDRELEQVRLFASIDHPNLVTMEDMGVVNDVPYLIMGYAGEQTLARRMKSGDLDPATAMRYFIQACRGVLALHDRRLAHFDLKPGNVFIKGDVARVGDYGLAKLLTEGRQTLSFGRGTPHYMAPEMLKNRADHRADLYSLGVILFESLAGYLPFGSDNRLGVVVRERDDPPTFPEDFPADVKPVVERCLHLDPDDRYESVYGVLEELGQTARQGDSVRIRWGGIAPSPKAKSFREALHEGEVDGDPGAPPAQVPSADEHASHAPAEQDTPSTSSDLKRAAAELARGAAGVAAGVWSGVVKRFGASRKSPAKEEPPAPAEPLGEDVVSVSTLDQESGAPPANSGAPAPRAETTTPEVRAPLQTAAVQPVTQPLPEPVREPPALLSPAPYGVGSGFASTVPVPPTAEGGIVGNIAASVILGTEILGALVTGPVVYGLRAVGTFIDRGVRGAPGALGSVLRMLMFLVILFLLGGLAAFVILALVTLNR